MRCCPPRGDESPPPTPPKHRKKCNKDNCLVQALVRVSCRLSRDCPADEQTSARATSSRPLRISNSSFLATVSKRITIPRLRAVDPATFLCGCHGQHRCLYPSIERPQHRARNIIRRTKGQRERTLIINSGCDIDISPRRPTDRSQVEREARREKPLRQQRGQFFVVFCATFEKRRNSGRDVGLIASGLIASGLIASGGAHALLSFHGPRD